LNKKFDPHLDTTIYLISLLMSGMIGLFVGLSELVNRYNSFKKIFVNIYSWIYLLINFLAAVLAYYIIKKYKLNLGSISEHEIGFILISGLGAMAFLRSSFFSFKSSSGQIISIGPAALLTIFLRAAESEFDRIMANNDINNVSILMKDINFASASKDLPLIILASMRVLNNEEQKSLSDDILKLVNDTTATTEAKSIALGVILTKSTGYALLKTAVDSLREIYQTKTKVNLEKLSTFQNKLNAL
jgi:hypothetical protein